MVLYVVNASLMVGNCAVIKTAAQTSLTSLYTCSEPLRSLSRLDSGTTPSYIYKMPNYYHEEVRA